MGAATLVRCRPEAARDVGLSGAEPDDERWHVAL
ncbi:MAG: hypothetical protein UZ03_NOB001000189, partial [Nitrospira sp. OLB3]